jgi:uncharacterized protein
VRLICRWFHPVSGAPGAAVAGLLLAVAFPLLAQQSTQSPVFKAYKPPRPGAIVDQSDITYQLWHTFDLAQKAGAGDILAQEELAVRYLTGRGVKSDTARGAFWTLRAAAQNMPAARFNLGILYSNGWGVEWNPFAAYEQFLWCAQRGMPEAQYIIGTILMENLVVARDWHAVVGWLSAAADSGYAPARELLADVRSRAPASQDGPPGPVTPPSDSLHASAQPSSTLAWAPVFLDFETDTGKVVDEATLIGDLLNAGQTETLRALGLSDSTVHLEDPVPGFQDALRRAADAGSPEALTLLGRCSERGLGVERDPVEAAADYLRAIRLDSPRAPELLLALLDGPGAMELVRARAKAGDATASFVIAALVGLRLTGPLQKSGSWMTEGEALRLLRRAADARYVPAMLELGVWYYAGRIGTADRDGALAIWEEAAELGNKEARVRSAAAQAGPDSAARVDLFKLAAGEGSIVAQVALAYCMEQGTGVPVNRGNAARLYRSAAQRGSQDAYRALLRMYDAIRPADARFELSER